MKYYLGFDENGYVIYAQNFPSDKAQKEYEVPESFNSVEFMDAFRLKGKKIVLDEEKLERLREAERNEPSFMEVMLAKVKEELHIE